MKKLFFLAAITFSLIACNSNKDKRFCECLTISQKLDGEAMKYSSRALDATTDEEVANLKKLVAEKDSICLPYENLSGDELKKKQAACN